VLLPYSAPELFDLIEQVEHYPQFLPWCTAATVLERSEDWVAARLEFSFHGLCFGFQTRNPKQRPNWLHVRLVEGPFERMQAEWALTAIGELGCRIDFAFSCEIADRMLDRLARPAAAYVARKMMEAFVQRAARTLKPCAGAAEAGAASGS
jgi:ribosome-associated toxin RatA of RatAB toxin-antitoxin module